MIKPVILVVNPEPEVLWAIKDDLQRKYNGNFRVLQTDSETTALKRLNQLQEQNDSVTLLVMEQQKSQMAGKDFLKSVMEIFPKAKRVLLTVYDTDDVPIQLPLPKAVVVD